LVLQWAGTQGTMQIDGHPVALIVKEEQCRKNCVSPGKTGVRVFQFRGEGVRATLRKKLSCARDAEVCSGLPEGSAYLAVSTARGRTELAVRNEYCDL